MQRTVVIGPGEFELQEAPVSGPGAGEALVRVRACGICGSDLAYLRDGGLSPGVPIAIGHEIVGIVETIGPGVSSLKVGDRVAINGSAEGNYIGSGGSEGGLADFVLLRHVDRGDVAYSVPDAMPDRRAALIEPLAVGRRAVNRSEAQPGHRVCIFGAGPIGLGILASLRSKGIDDVVVVDTIPFRRDLALRLGARSAVDPDNEDVEESLARLHGATTWLGRRVTSTDIYFDAAGAAPVISSMVEMSRRGASIVLVAVYNGAAEINWRQVLAHEVSIIASLGHPTEFPEVIDMLVHAGDSLDALITHDVHFSELPRAIDVAANATASGKVVVHFFERSG